MGNVISLFKVSLSILLFFAVSANAAFVSIEDFEALSLGNIGGQNGWVAGSSTVAVDPDDPDNQMLAVIMDSARAYKNMLIAHGDVRMMFLRFRFEEQLSCSFGPSHVSNPTEYSDFGPELNLVHSSTDLNTANSHTTGIYDTIATDLSAGTWYNLWVLVDNIEKESQVWLNTEGNADSGDKLSNDDQIEIFGFRVNTGSYDLVNFYVRASSGGTGDFGPLYIDDIYLENADQTNLINPVPEPVTVLIIALGGLFISRRRPNKK